MKIIEYKGNTYPHFQSEGFAAQFAFPFAEKLCKGIGVDVGCMKKEWAFPGSIPIDIDFPSGFHAENLPFNSDGFDYIFSSHCLEHLENYVSALEYWHSRLKAGGVLFLYLPDMNQQVYWRPWHNRKHIHYLFPELMRLYAEDVQLWENVFVSNTDLNASFYFIAEKK
jgi:predicted SAM-dependent methyltransferase